VVVEKLPRNRGVGGAVLAGYRVAIDRQADVIVKLDGDGQMDPTLISSFVAPILAQEADYTKGNRFFNLESLRSMPALRVFGNAGLSFISKLSSGYWKVMDPTNGYTAIDARIAQALPFEKISTRYFFESDMLFRLNTLQAVVQDIPMDSVYGDEQSNLRIKRVLLEFPRLHAIRFFKRIFYTYFLRDFNAASVQLLVGVALTLSGVIFGLVKWSHYSELNIAAPTGTVLLATIQVIIGIQCLLSWITYDVNCNPSQAISPRLRKAKVASLDREAQNVDQLERVALA
jgi:glycosyltransferase involved in cell wall biosynthesis